MEEAGAWCEFRLRLLDGTDGDTVFDMLGHLQDWNIQLTDATGTVEDVRLVDSGEDGCIVVAPIDAAGEICGPERYVKFEDIRAIGVF